MKCRLLVIILFVLVSACSKPADRTAESAAIGEGDIVIGVALPLNDRRHFLEGVELAIKCLNIYGVDKLKEVLHGNDGIDGAPGAQGQTGSQGPQGPTGNVGVLGGRNIRAIVIDDESFEDMEVDCLIRKGKKIAREFANDPDVVAVIGHNVSDVAVPVSIIYELNKTVFITPFATTPSLTKHGFRFVFRTVPTDTAYARRLAILAKQKFKNVLIIAVDDVYGENLSNNFHTFAEDLGVNIVGGIHFPPWEDDMKVTLMRRGNMIEGNMIEGKKFDDIFDAIFLAARMPKAARLIKMVRELNITGPFFGGDALDTKEVWEEAGDAAEGTIVCSTVINEGPALQEFRRLYKEEYGYLPEHWAAHTFDTVTILASAMEKAESTVPSKVEEALHFIQDWQGVTATFTFDGNGDVLDNTSGFKVLSKGEFTYNEELNKLVSEAEKKIAEKEKDGYEAIVEREKRKDVDTADGD